MLPRGEQQQSILETTTSGANDVFDKLLPPRGMTEDGRGGPHFEALVYSLILTTDEKRETSIGNIGGPVSPTEHVGFINPSFLLTRRC